MTEPTCECGHPATAHNGFWDDDNGRSGMACDECETCDDYRWPTGE